MRVSELAKNLAVNPDTGRDYTRIGLLRPRKMRKMDTRNTMSVIFLGSILFSVHDISGSQSKM